jgi:hypothetical protein
MSTFWQDPNLEPKRSYRFILSIPGGNGGTRRGIREFLVKKVSKPNFTITTQPHKFLNHQFHYPGRVEWQAIDATIVDTVSPDANATQEIMSILEQSGYEIPTNPAAGGGLGTVSKRKAVTEGLGQVTIRTIDSDGNTVEEWLLNNAMITKATFGDLDYDAEAMLETTVTLTYDNAYINVINGGGTFPATSS